MVMCRQLTEKTIGIYVTSCNRTCTLPKSNCFGENQ